jgi:hypothetical protein
VVRTYKSVKAYESDSQRMAALGYVWDASTSQQPTDRGIKAQTIGPSGARTGLPCRWPVGSHSRVGISNIGVGRFVALGFASLIFKPKPVLIVTYRLKETQ